MCYYWALFDIKSFSTSAVQVNWPQNRDFLKCKDKNLFYYIDFYAISFDQKSGINYLSISTLSNIHPSRFLSISMHLNFWLLNLILNTLSNHCRWKWYCYIQKAKIFLARNKSICFLTHCVSNIGLFSIGNFLVMAIARVVAIYHFVLSFCMYTAVWENG